MTKGSLVLYRHSSCEKDSAGLAQICICMQLPRVNLNYSCVHLLLSLTVRGDMLWRPEY